MISLSDTEIADAIRETKRACGPASDVALAFLEQRMLIRLEHKAKNVDVRAFQTIFLDRCGRVLDTPQRSE